MGCEELLWIVMTLSELWGNDLGRLEETLAA